jgi:hypothetical protein
VNKCRYILENDLPPLATTEQLTVITTALSTGGFIVDDLASRYASQVWHVGHAGLITAVKQHFTSGKKIFQKFSNTTGELLPDKLHANVALYENCDDEHDDVYVELILRGKDFVVILNAHNHPRDCARLPK